MNCGAKYILMCKKAVEIQKERIALNGDLYYFCNSVRVVVHLSDSILLKYYGSNYKYSIVQSLTYLNDITWLPRQDQLQEMVNYSKNYFLLHKDFNKYVEFLDSQYQTNVDKMTLEQLWLAFVMKEKYNKIWDGENWESTPIPHEHDRPDEFKDKSLKQKIVIDEKKVLQLMGDVGAKYGLPLSLSQKLTQAISQNINELVKIDKKERER